MPLRNQRIDTDELRGTRADSQRLRNTETTRDTIADGQRITGEVEETPTFRAQDPELNPDARTNLDTEAEFGEMETAGKVETKQTAESELSQEYESEFGQETGVRRELAGMTDEDSRQRLDTELNVDLVEDVDTLTETDVESRGRVDLGFETEFENVFEVEQETTTELETETETETEMEQELESEWETEWETEMRMKTESEKEGETPPPEDATGQNRGSSWLSDESLFSSGIASGEELFEETFGSSGGNR